jgi:hypothetical protein
MAETQRMAVASQSLARSLACQVLANAATHTNTRSLTAQARLQRELAFFDVFPIDSTHSRSVGGRSDTLVGGPVGSALQVIGMATIVAAVVVGVTRFRRV